MTVTADTPLCPFCAKPWTAAMLAQLEQHSGEVYCACCAGGPEPRHVGGPLNLPTRDLCCEYCGKPIYRAPTTEAR